MYSCGGLEAASILYHCNFMGGRKAWVLREHLSRCHRCKDYLEKMGRVSRMAREYQGRKKANSRLLLTAAINEYMIKKSYIHYFERARKEER